MKFTKKIVVHLQNCHGGLLPVHEAFADLPAGAPVVHARGVALHLALFHAVNVDRRRRVGLARRPSAMALVSARFKVQDLRKNCIFIL